MTPNIQHKFIRALISSAATLCIAITGIFVSCNDEVSFTTSPSALLTIPNDTLQLDTCISGLPTSTYSFVIQNRGSKGIKIVNARIENADATGFQANIDGVNINDTYTYPIEVRGKDSITVWVKLNTRPKNSDDVQAIADRLLLTLESGAIQQIVLLGYSQDVTTLNNITLNSDTLISSKRPVHVVGNLKVAQGTTLTIAAGTKLLLSPTSEILVDGTLIAEGTQEKPIIFRGDRLDHMFTHQMYDRVPGQWKGITFASTSFNNHLDHCDIHSGSYGVRCDSSATTSTSKLKLENTIVHNMKGDCLTLVNSKVFIGNSQITNALGNTVTLYGGENHFVHCTIGNFYPFTGNRGKALYLYNSLSVHAMPLKQALFENCIISGWSDDELFSAFLDDNTARNYLFRNCLLTTPEVDDKSSYPGSIFENTQDTLWGSRNFKNFDDKNLIYDFHLRASSAARGAADTQITQTFYPYDLNGRDRLTPDGKADIGCYEYEKGKGN